MYSVSTVAAAMATGTTLTARSARVSAAQWWNEERRDALMASGVNQAWM